MALGAVTGATGALVLTLFLLQPWRSCSYDDRPSACAMLPADASVLMVSAITTLAGVTVLVMAWLSAQEPRSMPASRRVTVFGAVPLCFVVAVAGVLYFV